ncbi:CidA/LrgA family protein [Acetivibrio clariflavus]|uniref:Putative effector of murein hydrolase LrgA n=1 Tax=Acetivibrio clariflavus (strain DSM 19732 / NBRC 101661 / EBR45) TaxID=720554 RepID=G8LUU9_ACECE|nr:CidA/LrgA family protein [Acetivibrio clariflavus]AEV68479.1 putative effector of murein hydrolase LrgA [Acetivibrio clariflavus DSM 19732]
MKFLKQFGIILGVSFIGEVLKYFIPLPIPASIYGLVIMLLLLSVKIVSVEQVKDTGSYLIEIMPVMFIPAAVGLITMWSELKSLWFPLCVITVVTTVIVMAAAGRVTQFIIRMEKRQKE